MPATSPEVKHREQDDEVFPEVHSREVRLVQEHRGEYALAQTINGLQKVGLRRHQATRQTRDSMELTTSQRVRRVNHRRLLEPIGHIPQTEAEANDYQHRAEKTNSKVSTQPTWPRRNLGSSLAVEGPGLAYAETP